MLSQSGYTSSSLASSDERDYDSLTYRYRLVYPERDQQGVNKMQPDCPKLAQSSKKCKYEISANLAHNVINAEGKNAFNTSYIRGEIGEYEGLSQENIPHIHKPNGWLWKRVSGQLVAKSLEWVHWGEFLNMAEFTIKKGRSV